MRTYRNVVDLIYLNTKATYEQALEYARYCYNHSIDGMDAIRYAEEELKKNEEISVEEYTKEYYQNLYECKLY